MRPRPLRCPAGLLPSGRVLVLGGDGGGGVGLLASAEVFDVASGQWLSAGTLPSALTSAGVVTLNGSGRVLVSGGLGTSGTLSASGLYSPAP